VFRDHRRRRTLSDRERPTGHVQPHRVERGHLVRAEARDGARWRDRGARFHPAMTVLSSLRSRIFLASALLAVLCIGVAISLVNVTVTKEAERTLEREIVATGAQVDQLRAERTQTFTLMARLIADLPKLKAAMETNDPPTVQDIAGGYQAQL